jgi:tetratricopeptide (TPR) repeat protein
MLSICRTSLRGFVALVALVALAWPELAFAQAAPADTARPDPQAKSHFEAGVAAYEEGRFRDAVERFKEADALAPSALLSFNIAKVYERMADNRNALAYYRDYLRRLPDADNRRAVSERVRDLEEALKATGVQQLTVLSTPVGATVSIDNVSRGVTPWTGELIPGPHTLALRLIGYREVVTEIELPAEHAIDIDTPLVAAEPEAAPAAVAAPVSAPDAPAPVPVAYDLDRTPRWWTWALLGGSAAALASAGAFELARGDLEDQARRSRVQVEHLEKFEAMEQRQTVARVFLGVGIVAALAGGASLYFDLQEPTPPAVAFGCLPTGCTFEAGGRF